MSFLLSLLGNWRLVAIVLLVAVPSIWGAVMRLQRDHARAEYATYRTKVAQAAAAAAEVALKKTIADEQRKEKADAEHAAAVARLNSTIRRLRDARAASSFVPAAASCPGSPDRAAFDRAVLERTIRALDTGVQGLVDEGSRAVTDLDTAKRWAAGR